MGAMCQRASTGEMGAASSCSSANATGAPAGEKLAGSRKGPRHIHVAGLGRRAWPEQMLRAQMKRLVSGHRARRLRRRNRKTTFQAPRAGLLRAPDTPCRGLHFKMMY